MTAPAEDMTFPDRYQEPIDRIMELHRRRTAWHRAEKGLTLQGKAICRRICDGDKKQGSELFDAVAKMADTRLLDILSSLRPNDPDSLRIHEAVIETHPIILARRGIAGQREQVEKQIEMHVKMLPIVQWIDNITGVSYGSVGAVIGSAGDLRGYPTPQTLWKRMGLAVIEGERQRLVANAEMALIHGYNPARRSIMWNVGTSLLRAQSERSDKETGEVTRETGYYRKVYDRRRAYENEKNERGDYAQLAARQLKEKTYKKNTSAYKAYSQGKLPPLHLHQRAQRYVEKTFLLDLWRRWHKIMPKIEEEVRKERAA